MKDAVLTPARRLCRCAWRNRARCWARGGAFNLLDPSDVYMTFFVPETVAGRIAHRQRGGSCSTPCPARGDPGPGVLRRQPGAVHAQDGGDGQRAPEADVPRACADRAANRCAASSRSRPECRACLALLDNAQAWPASLALNPMRDAGKADFMTAPASARTGRPAQRRWSALRQRCPRWMDRPGHPGGLHGRPDRARMA